MSNTPLRERPRTYIVFCKQRPDNLGHLDERQRPPETHAVSLSKAQIRVIHALDAGFEFGVALGGLLEPALGEELVRALAVDFGSAVHDPGVHADDGARRKRDAIVKRQAGRGDNALHDVPHNGMDTKTLLDARIQVLEIFKTGKRCRVAEVYGAQFLDKARVHGGVLERMVDDGFDGNGGGVAAAEDVDDHVGDYLIVGDDGGVLLFGLQEVVHEVGFTLELVERLHALHEALHAEASGHGEGGELGCKARVLRKPLVESGHLADLQQVMVSFAKSERGKESSRETYN